MLIGEILRSFMRKSSTLLAALLAAGACIALWVWNMAHVPTLVNDDAFIFMRYAMNWVDHGILAWNRDAVGSDGFTSFAHQALAALAYLVRRDDPLSAVWYLAATLSLGTVMLSCALPLSAGLRGSARPVATILAAFAATCVSSALNPQFAYYTHSLMESSLVAFTVCLASWSAAHLLTGSPASRGWSVLAGGALGSLALVRPEGMLVCGVVCLLLGLRIAGAGVHAKHFRRFVAPVEKRAVVPLLLGLLTAGLIAGGYFAWHLARYHHPFPNPVYVKTAGVSPASIAQGVGYLVDGPAAGSLPLGAVRFTATAPAQPVPQQAVHAAVTPDRSPVPYWTLLSLIPLLWALSFQGRVFALSRDAMFLRHFLLIPTGWLLLVVLSGGDIWHSGWRFVTPLLPAVTLAAVLALRWVRLPDAAWILGAILALLLARTIFVALDRPELCREAASACGVEAIERWPPDLRSYEWDVSNAWYDHQVAQALRASFPSNTVIGQADFLRIGTHLPEFTIADLSGLTDGDLAHRSHAAEVRLFDADLLVEVRPAVYLYGYRFISERNLAKYRLGDAAVGELLYPWPPRGSPAALRKIVELYAGASVSFPNGTFFNFLVLREALPTMTSRDHILIGS